MDLENTFKYLSILLSTFASTFKKVDAKVRGPTGQNPFDYIGVRGEIRPMIWIKSVYFGGNSVTLNFRLRSFR